MPRRPPYHEPTPTQIAAVTARIRKDWSDEMYNKRADLPTREWTPPRWDGLNESELNHHGRDST